MRVTHFQGRGPNLWVDGLKGSFLYASFLRIKFCASSLGALKETTPTFICWTKNT